MKDPLDYTMDELLASIEEITADPPQDGFLTVVEWGRVWGKSLEVTRDAIKKLLIAGKMERSYRTEVSLLDGHIYKTNTFGIKGTE